MLSPSTPSKPTAAASTTFAPGVSPVDLLPDCLLSDKLRSGDNSHFLKSCLSKMHTTLLRVRISCASGPQFQLSRPRRMALLSLTYTAACMSSTRNLSPSQAGSHTLVDA